MLTLSNLSKRFGSLQALDRLSLSLEAGEIVGFVGANGAGKSTTMRIVMGVLAADCGTVTWKGSPVDAATRRAIGYMPEERGLYPRMKVAEQLVYLARLHGLSASSAKAAANQWTERLGLEERRGDEVQSLSLGNQQRVQLAAALVSDPELLILDEPFSGLDPVAVDVMSQVLLERAAAGVPTLFSSHQLDVVERLCDRVVIIRSGRLVADGTVPELQATETPRWRVVVEPPLDAAPLEADSLSTLTTPDVQLDDQGRLVITAAGTDEQALLSTAQRLGTVRELGPVRHPLTEIFRDVLTATSHQLDVVERLCDRVVIIRSGRLVADGTVPELQATETPRWRVVVEPPLDAAPLETDSLSTLTAPDVQLDDQGRLVITAAGADEQVLLSTVQRLGTVRELGPVRHPLTEIFRDVLTSTSHEGTTDTNETKEAHR